MHANSDCLLTLQRVNLALRLSLSRLRPENKGCSTISAKDFSDLLAELLSARECLHHLADTSSRQGQTRSDPPNPAPIPAVSLPDAAETVLVARETRAYRDNLEQLSALLPSLHSRLLTEKHRLQNAQSHVMAAAGWSQARKETL